MSRGTEPNTGDALVVDTPCPWTSGFVDFRATGAGTGLPESLGVADWEQASPDGGFVLAAYLFHPPYERDGFQDCVLTVRDASTQVTGSVVVHRGGAMSIPAQRLAQALYGLKPILDNRATPHADLGDYHGARVDRAWANLPALHEALTDRSRLDALTAAAGSVARAVEYASHGVRSTDTAHALTALGLAGSRLHWWRNKDFTCEEVAVWAALLDAPPVPEWRTGEWTPQEAAAYIVSGVHRPERLYEWRATGMSEQDIRDWAFTGGPTMVGPWRSLGMPADITRAWHAWGKLPPRTCLTARQRALTIPEADALLHAIDPNPPPEDLGRAEVLQGYLTLMRDLSVPPDLVHLFALAGFDPATAASAVLEGKVDEEGLRTLAALRGRYRPWADAVAEALTRTGP